MNVLFTKKFAVKFSIFAIIYTLFLQFFSLEKYIYNDIYKEFPFFTNNFVWLFALAFILGAGLYLLFEKFNKTKSEGMVSVLLLVWAGLSLFVGFVTLYVLQTILHTTKVNSITMLYPVIFAVFGMVMGASLFPMIAKLSKKITYYNISIANTIFVAILFASSLNILAPKAISYNGLFIIAGVILFVASVLYTFSKEEAIYIQEKESIALSKINKIAYILISVVMIISFTMLFVNMDEFMTLYGYGIKEYYFAIIICPIVMCYILSMLTKNINSSILDIVMIAVFALSMLVLAFVVDFIAIAILFSLTSASMYVILKKIFKNISVENNAKSLFVKYVLLLVLPITLGYIFGTWLTYGFGYMFDIFMAIYLEPIRTWAMLFRSESPLATGEVMKYFGIGERYVISFRRYGFIPSNVIMFITMAGGLLSMITYAIVKVVLKKN